MFGVQGRRTPQNKIRAISLGLTGRRLRRDGVADGKQMGRE
jgi:hypothetical protein